MNEHSIQRVHQLQLYCRHRVNHQLIGPYRSVFRGQGLEFDEVRAYQPGDDVRAIDWHVTARLGEVHIKQFHEERQLNLIFVVDNSPSFAWSSQGRDRLQVAAEFCGLLGAAALDSNDRIGLVRFSEGMDDYLPPTRGFNQLLRCLSAILEPPRLVRSTSIIETVEHLNRLKLKRSLIVVLSDFFFDGFVEELAILNRHHDVISIAIDDPREKRLAGGGLACLKDVEGGERHWVDMSSQPVRDLFRDQITERMKQREQRFSHWGLDLITHALEEDPVENLLSCFLSRQQRMAGESGG